MLTRLGDAVSAHLRSGPPWTNVYGLARTIMASATILTLVCSDTYTLFRPAAGVTEFPHCSTSPGSFGFFCLPVALPVLRWLAVIALLVIASGWRPRYTGVVHWWLATSYHLNASVIDGGDQVNQILTLLLIPVTLTDSRTWHWQPPGPADTSASGTYRSLVANVAMVVIRVQVAGIYFHAAIGKFAVEQWANGTALYYWLQDGVYGAPEWTHGVVRPLLHNGTTLALATWSVMVLEYALGAALIVRIEYRRALLWAGFALHGGILVLQGISSFSVVMMAALILYLEPWQRPLHLPTPELSRRVHRIRLFASRPRLA